MTTDNDGNVSHALELRPVLGDIARQWQRIHPYDLTVPEALSLLSFLTGITDRLDAGCPSSRGDPVVAVTPITAGTLE